MFVTVFLAAYAAGPDMGPTNGADYAGMDYNVTQWNTPKSKSADNYKSSALACEAYCDADPKCCAWTCETDAPYIRRSARSAPTSRLDLRPAGNAVLCHRRLPAWHWRRGGRRAFRCVQGRWMDGRIDD